VAWVDVGRGCHSHCTQTGLVVAGEREQVSGARSDVQLVLQGEEEQVSAEGVCAHGPGGRGRAPPRQRSRTSRMLRDRRLLGFA